MIELEQVSNSVWAYTGQETHGNVACIKLDGELVMVDSGMDPVTIAEIRKKAEERTGAVFKYLVLTHPHTDHVFGNQAFNDCEIIATKPVAEIMKQNKQSQWSKEKLEERRENNPEFKEKWKDLRIILPTTTFTGTYVIEGEERKVKIVETGGHTKGDVYLFVPDEEILIAGDLLFARAYPYGGDPTADPYKWVKGFDEMIQLNPEKIVPGHGPVSTVDELNVHKNYMEKVLEKMEEAVRNGVSKEELTTLEWPEFPYELDPARHQGMMEQTFKVVRRTMKQQ